jgi:hypothetical protein
MSNQNLILIEQFSLHHGVDVTFLTALRDYGMVDFIVVEEQQYLDAVQLPVVEKIIRLHNDLDINLEGIDAIMNLQQRMGVLQQELNLLKNRLRLIED